MDIVPLQCAKHCTSYLLERCYPCPQGAYNLVGEKGQLHKWRNHKMISGSKGTLEVIYSNISLNYPEDGHPAT